MPRVERPSGSRPRPGEGFVGRRREYLELLGALKETLGGGGQLRLIAGEAGIGKTRLAAELAAAARARGIAVLWAACEADPHAPPYWPWSQLLRSALEPLSEREREVLLEGAADELARLIDAVRLPLPDTETTESRFRLFDEIATFWRRFARGAGAVLILDDLHDADGGSIELLGFVARRTRDAPLLLLATYRDVDVSADVEQSARIAALRPTGHARLGGLALDEVSELVTHIAGRAPAQDVSRAIHARTEGNPFFVDAVTRLMLSAGSLELASGEAARLPAQVQSAIRTRLGQLAPRARATLAAASALGLEFDLALLARASGESGAGLRRILESPASRLAVEPVGAARSRFRFTHALIQETLYEDLLPDERAELHGRIGEALEELHAADSAAQVGALAHHFLRAAVEPKHTEKAVAYAFAAGRSAQAGLGYAQAVQLFEAALQRIELAPDEQRELECRLALAAALVQEARLDRAHEQARRALGLARSLRDSDGLARAALHLAGGGENGFAPEIERVAVLREALAAIAPGPSALRVLLMTRLAQATYFSERMSEAVRLGQDALALARALGDPAAIAAALNTLRWLWWEPGNARQRLALCDEQLALAREIDSLDFASKAHFGHAEIWLELGDLASARAALEAHQDDWRELRTPDMEWGGELLRSIFAAIEGRLDAAESHARHALEVGERIDARLAHEWFAVQQILIRTEQGRAAEILPALRKLAESRPLPQVRAGLARSLARAGERAQADELLRSLCTELPALRRDVNWPFTLACLAEVAHTLGDTGAARQIYDELACYDGHQVILGLKLGWIGPVAHFLGLLAATLGERERAHGHLEAALAQCRELGAARLAAQIESELANLGGAAAHPRADRMADARRAVLRSVGEYWQIGWEGAPALHRDTKGFSYLARLIRDPGRELHAIDLVTGDARVRRSVGGDAGPALDARARAEYGRRVAELREELAEAERFDDALRASRAREELDLLSRELGRRVGLGGRTRRDASAAERARVNATRTLALALRKIEAQTPELGRLLRRAIHTGTFFRYEPDPDRALEWLL